MSTVAWVVASVAITVLLMGAWFQSQSSSSSSPMSSCASSPTSSPTFAPTSSPTFAPTSPTMVETPAVQYNTNMMYPTYDQVMVDRVPYRTSSYYPQSLMPDPYAGWNSMYWDDYFSPGYNWISGRRPYHGHQGHHPHPEAHNPQPPMQPVVNVTQTNKNISVPRPAMGSAVASKAGRMSVKSPRRSSASSSRSLPVPTAAASVLAKLDNPSSAS